MDNAEVRSTYGQFRRRARSIAGFTLVKLLAPVVRRLTDSKYFYAFERLGVHVTSIHFYQPIPDTRNLDESPKEAGQDSPGIDFRAPVQRKLLKMFATRYGKEYARFPRTKKEASGGFFLDNGAFGGVDAEILYCMVRFLRPHRITEIGCGFSSLVTAGAIRVMREHASHYSCTFTGIDPYPPAMLEGVKELSRMVRIPVQIVPLEEFESLRSGDILFIDSSHVLTTGGDVQFELLQVLPRLRKGVYVHIHDIFLPLDYPRDWQINKAIFWNEQYAVQAFLEFNDSFEIVWSSAYMSLRHPRELQNAIGSFDPKGPRPASLWMRRVR